MLESAVTVEQRLGIGVCLHSHVEGIKDELAVIVFADGEGHNIPALEVENGAEIQLLTIAILHFGHVGEPLLIGLLGSEISPQIVFRCYLRCGVLVSRMHAANDRLQLYKLCQMIEVLVVVSCAVALNILVCQPPVSEMPLYSAYKIAWKWRFVSPTGLLFLAAMTAARRWPFWGLPNSGWKGSSPNERAASIWREQGRKTG